MGELSRIIARYLVGIAVGYLVAGGLLPQELATQISGNEEIMNWLANTLPVAAAVTVEYFWRRSKAPGATLTYSLGFLWRRLKGGSNESQ